MGCNRDPLDPRYDPNQVTTSSGIHFRTALFDLYGLGQTELKIRYSHAKATKSIGLIRWRFPYANDRCRWHWTRFHFTRPKVVGM